MAYSCFLKGAEVDPLICLFRAETRLFENCTNIVLDVPMVREDGTVHILESMVNAGGIISIQRTNLAT